MGGKRKVVEEKFGNRKIEPNEKKGSNDYGLRST